VQPHAAGIVAEAAIALSDLQKLLHGSLVVAGDQLHGAQLITCFQVIGVGDDGLFQLRDRRCFACGAQDGHMRGQLAEFSSTRRAKLSALASKM